MNEHYLYPGMLFTHPEPHRITTVLGSCIAVCLFDPVRRLGGMNHYMLPVWSGEGLPTPKYGNVAIDLLIERLAALGCQVSRLQAKLFGGAAMWESGNSPVSVGDRNIDLAWRLLDRNGIQVVASDLGGGFSRKLIFYTTTGDVFLKRHPGSARGGVTAGAGLMPPDRLQTPAP
jgi:chemotaxis protein CheD